MKRILQRILLWLRIIRPQTLFASLVPVLVGILASGRSGIPYATTSPVAVCIVTAVCALSLQILSNLINDYYDFVRGSDKAGRKGFKRALAEGEVSGKDMKAAIFTDLAVVVATGLFLVFSGRWVILAIGVSAILFAWLYTATSHSLSYLGIADIFVFLYYGVIASSGTAYLLTHQFIATAFHAGAVCGLISMGVLMINNLRDIEDDRAAGKRTLPVRFGKKAAEAIMFAEVLLMPVFAYLAFGLSAAMLIAVPAVILFSAVRKAEGARYNKCLLFTGLMNVLYFFLCLLS
ncbi:MAG: 1,4-dihydroxy-2-naphthoate octaprenyltransferase [Bacteroidales bacterium]|nr:1,4-dihydroxy-2-naphthoate octaprenyltransferase [Candidatus Cacconaster merdequi]